MIFYCVHQQIANKAKDLHDLSNASSVPALFQAVANKA